jgi:acetate kinase
MSIGVGYECLSNKEIYGAYTAVLNGLDAIIFTAGIGENSSTSGN